MSPHPATTICTILPQNEETNLVLGLARALQIPFYVYNLHTSAYDVSYLNISIDENTQTVIPLFHEVNITDSAPQSLLVHQTTFANYTVGSGKTANIYVVIESKTNNLQFKIWESNNANTANGNTKYTSATTVFDVDNRMTLIDVGTFAAGKFVTFEVTSSSTELEVLHAFAVES